MNEILKKFILSGLPVIPIIKTKKEPLIPAHAFLDSELPNIDHKFYKQITDCDFALKCGNDQTKIECIDIDLKNLKKGKDEYWKKLSEIFPLDVLQTVFIESTPSGGMHLAYKSEMEIPPSCKIAKTKGIKEAIIETRGRGGYFVCAPSTGYKILQGDIFNLPKLSIGQIEEVKRACYAMDECPPEQEKKSPTTAIQRVFNSKNINTAYELLISNGWSEFKKHPDRVWLTRPGKEKGVSGTFYLKTGFFYPFSSSTEFTQKAAYSPYDIILILNGTTPEAMEKIATEQIGEKYIFDVTREIMRNNLKLKPIDVKDCLNKTILDHMLKNGYFITDINNAFYFSNKKLINVKSEKFNWYIYSIFSIQKTDQIMNYVLQSIIHYAFTYGKKMRVYNYTIMKDNTVYIDNFNGSVWKITTKDILLVDNGTDDILFLEQDFSPIEYQEGEIKIFSELTDGFIFDESHTLSAMDSSKLFTYWILSIYFLSVNKPILALIGQPGSGKSFLFKRILFFLFGHFRQLKLAPEKASDFWPMATNNKVLFLDNLDTYTEWLNDALAVCATATTHTVRELYTTNTEACFPVDCFLGVTSRTPPFTRDDIADRLLLLHFSRFTEFPSETLLIEETKRKRNQVMSFIFNFIKTILNILNNDKTEIKSITRMADFEIFCRKINPTMTDVFKKLQTSQKEFSENDTFSDGFYSWCKDQNGLGITSITARELAHILNEKNKTKFTSHYIGYKLKNTYSFCDIEKTQLRANRNEYKITFKE